MADSRCETTQKGPKVVKHLVTGKFPAAFQIARSAAGSAAVEGPSADRLGQLQT
jgi:hypothetical protein